MKLKGLNNQAWVTCANTDEEARNGIILAKSLKRVASNRNVVMFVSTNVTPKLRTFLHAEFDFVFMLETDTNVAKLKPSEFGKLSAFTLNSFDRCCFFSPSMMFLKNADHIFDLYSDADFTCLERDTSLSIFVYKPSLDTYNALIEALKFENRNGSSVVSYIQNWFCNQHAHLNLPKEQLYLGHQFNRVINWQAKNVAKIEVPTAPVHDTFIVNFLSDPVLLSEETMDTSKLGLIDYYAINSWMIHYQEFLNEQTSKKRVESVREPIAIVGMSCRYPGGANSIEEFWKLLYNGEDGTSNPPPFRWLRENSIRNRPECRKTNAGFLQVPVDEFDGKFFGISPKEAYFMDPQLRLLHELVWEGLEDAAIDPLTLRGSNGGVFIGSWINDFKDILMHAGESEFFRLYMGNSIGAAAARISFLLGLTGPSVATESGCSSAMVAVHMACRSLLLGETKMALACGVNLILHPFNKDDSIPMVMSPTGRCKTFDANADGFARAEGCGVLVLKRFSDAIRDNDHIWAVIRGSGISQEGVSRSMGTPTVHCESLAMELALKDAQVDPKDVSYVEAHGTGTAVGDPMEVCAIAKAYHSNERKEPLIIGSVKTNIGHTESCSGITGIMKTVLAMHHEIIPAHKNFEVLNPNINLESVPAVLPLEPREWKKSKKRRIAGVSSFGITGTDAHAIIEEPPELPKFEIESVERPKHLLKISAKTKEALHILLERYKDNLTHSPSALADICYSANLGRANFPFRAVVIGEEKEDLVRKMNQGIIQKQEVTEHSGKICFLFTGQGSQYPGMAKKLYDSSPLFQMHFDYCAGLLKEMYGISIRDVLWGQDQDQVSRTIYSQTSIFCVEYALLKLWESWGVKPDYALGHSLGEFGAAVCAGILEPQDAIKLVAERSRLIDNLPEGKMLVIRADKSTVDKHFQLFGNSEKALDYAAFNSSEQTVVAGDSETILQFAEHLSSNKLKSIVLQSSHAFHSRHMDLMLDEYGKVAETVGNSRSRCEYISGMRGSLVDSEGINADYWVQHTRQPVNFMEASKTAVDLGCDIFIEVGPQPVLSALTMMNAEGVTCLPSLKKSEAEWDTLLESLGKLYLKGVSIDWKGFDELYPRKKVRLPHYPFIGKKYWPDMMTTTGTSIHPLLGSLIPNASPTKIFQNGLNLRCLEYLRDHAIGKSVVFPGAGYLEMSLAAGLATVESSTDTMTRPSRPMKLENLNILMPMALEESNCQVQVVVDFNSSDAKGKSGDWNDLSIKIFHRLESKWVLHSTALFVPLPSAEEIKSAELDPAIMKLKDHTSDDKIILKAYQKLASFGLKFGPTFQSLEKVWRDEGEMLAQVKIPPDTESKQYIIHPVVLDAMIQAVVVHNYSDKIRKLHVPLSISKFLWLANPQGEQLFIYTSGTQGLADKAVLLDEFGTAIAEMSGIDLIETTAKAVESVLDQQTSLMPNLWEESWRGKQGPMQNRLPLETKYVVTQEFRDLIEKNCNRPSETNEKIFETLEELAYLWMLNALYDCGLTPKLWKCFTTEELVLELKIQECYTKYVNYLLEVMEQYGHLRKSGAKWEWITMPPQKNEVMTQLSLPIYGDDLIKIFDSARLIHKLGQNLGKVLQGNESGLSILFPQDTKNDPSAAKFYVDYPELFKVLANARIIVERRLQWCKTLGENFVLRIVEIGAGTGMSANEVLPVLEEMDIKYEYTFTDISAAFFPTAEKRFEKYVHNMKFKKLNIEEDPIEQGFCPEYYDYAIASEVIHATKDICRSLRNCRKLLRRGGTLDLWEQLEKNRVTTFLFGVLEGFWRFEDFRRDHCVVSGDGWKRSLEQSGFEGTTVFPCFKGRHGLICSDAAEMVFDDDAKLNDVTWLIFATERCKLSKYVEGELMRIGRKSVVILPGNSGFEEVSSKEFKLRGDVKSDFDELMGALQKRGEIEGVVFLWPLDGTRTKQEEILQPFFYIAQSILSLKQKITPRLCAVTHAVAPIGDLDLSNFYHSTLWGFAKALRNEATDLNCRCIGITNGLLSEREMREVYCEIWSDDKESQVTYSNGLRHVARFIPVKVTSSELSLPSGTNRFQLVIPNSKSFADLTFGPLEVFELGDGEIEVQVYASGLNFRDIFTVLKPIKYFENVNSVGFDFSGVVKRVGPKVTKWNVGDYVFGVNLELNAIPSHVRLNERDVLKVPDHMTLSEAATLPTVVATSYQCLVRIAKVSKEDTVLIHTASGGVGLTAIAICQNIGAQIIATAGSKRKRNYLRGLGIEHIFNSRNTDFSDQILEVTNGRGVDVVLNSLTGEGFKEASLKACAKGARFVEMSKIGVWEPEEVQRLRPDVKYHEVDLTEVKIWREILKNMEEFINQGITKPIPYEKFDAVNICDAMWHLQKAKHIGKVICVMPQLQMEDGVCKTLEPMFSDRSTYLITGGLGGIGFEVAKWMVRKGAKTILLAGRNPYKSKQIQAIIDQLNSDGANIIPVQLDVGNYEECKRLLESISRKDGMNLPALRGIMHAAGTLSNGLVANQEWSKLSSTFNAKVAGTWNLHELTLSCPLEHFVMFSSIVALFGVAGQSNHAAANCFEDALMHYRHSVGLCATTINWGQWSEVGVAVEVDIPGITPISTLQGLTALEYALKTHRIQTGVVNVESFVQFSKHYPQTAVYVDEHVWKADSSSTQIGMTSEEFWEQYDSTDMSGKGALIKHQLKNMLRGILKLENEDAIGDLANFQEMGVDSLMFVELKNAVQGLLGERVRISANALRDSNNVQLLSEQLIKLIEGDELEKVPTFDEVNALVREDCQLPESITAVDRPIKKISEVKRVLLTGGTGTLGPYILRELSQLPQIKEIYCLIRPNKSVSMQGRLETVLESLGLLENVDMGKVKCVAGNVSMPKLGMKINDWLELTEKVDGIIHLAVKAIHTEYYRKRDHEDVRSVNVTGTKNILEFACQGQVKHLYMASSLVAINTTNEDGTLSENWPEIGDFDGISKFAYPNSKFVGDILSKIAALERNIPVKVFRFPLISGDSKTGRFNLSQNHVMLRYLFILKEGVMPSNPAPMQLLPVDLCAMISLKIFFNEGASYEPYNVFSPYPDLEQEFVTIAEELGYSVDLVEFEEFARVVLDESQEDSAFSVFKGIYSDKEEMTKMYEIMESWLKGAENFWKSNKISAIFPQYFGLGGTIGYLENDLKFAMSQGWLPKI